MNENATLQRVTTHNETGEGPSLVSGSIPEPPPLIRLPLRLSPDRRRILDADGNAVLLQGDAAWSLIANTTLDEARFYIEDRRRKGFNTLIVSLIEYCFAQNPPRNLAADEPFTTPGDFRTPNGGYGSMQERFRVYGRDGEPCETCGAVIVRTVVGGRGTHFCPRCQRSPRASRSR